MNNEAMGKPKAGIRVPDELAELIRNMHPDLKRKVKTSLKIIISNPNEGKALRHELEGLRSFRVGRFRILYRIVRKEIEIVAIGPRERIYEETYLLLKREDRK